MKMNKIILLSLCILSVVIIGLIVHSFSLKEPISALQKIRPAYQNLSLIISVNGVVEPQNRIEITPPVSGRIESIYVDEGDIVKEGDTLALMSSTDRAALLDAARNQGKEKVKYWEGVYKPTPLIAPANGQVIVRNVEPGQTINTSSPILVLADKLIVKAQVDETDIGRVNKGQKVNIVLDAYPNSIIEGWVSHISYESKIISNVTIYQVEIIPNKIPEIFRSGMSANIDIIENSKENVLTLPESAINYKNNKPYVFLKDSSKLGYKKTDISIGISENGYIEILSGVSLQDTVVIKKVNGTNKKKASSFFRRPGQRKSKK